LSESNKNIKEFGCAHIAKDTQEIGEVVLGNNVSYEGEIEIGRRGYEYLSGCQLKVKCDAVYKNQGDQEQ